MHAVLSTIIVYKVLLLAIGLAVARRNRSTSDYFLGSRGLGPWVAGISASASSSSAWTLVGVSAYAFSNGLTALWLLPACVGGFVLNWCVVAPRLQSLAATNGSLTVVELLASAPGRPRRTELWIRAVGSAIVLSAFVLYIANQFRAAGDSFEEVLDWNATESIVLGAAVVVAYTILGGFWAVSVTDTIQGLMMAATAVVLPLISLAAIGPSGLFEGMVQVGSSPETAGYCNLVPDGGALAVFALLGIGLGYPGQPHVVNRIMALRDRRAMRRGRTVAIGWAVLVYTNMILLGWCARVLSEKGITPVADSEKLIYLAAAALPGVLAGIVIATVLSAVMSTADSQLLVAASAIEHDLGASFRDGGDDQRDTSIWWARGTVLAVAGIAVPAALILDESIFNSVLFAWGAVGAAFGPLLLVRLFGGPVVAPATILSMVLGFGLSVLAYNNIFGSWLGEDTRGSVFERILPYAVAAGVAWAGTRRQPNTEGSL